MSRLKSAVIIGSGLGGLGSACILAKAGWSVTVLEKNNQLGGRVGLIEADGFRFDSGPSWMLMPDVFERFFALLGEDLYKHLTLTRLSPAFRVFYSDASRLDIYADNARDAATFERLEAGSGARFQQYLAATQYQYKLAINQFMYKNYGRRRDLLTPKVLREGLKLQVLEDLHEAVGKQFTSPHLRQLLEFAALFLGTRPSEIPALYGILNHALFDQGVFYPAGGMYALVETLARIAQRHGVTFRLNAGAQEILVEHGQAVGVVTANDDRLAANVVVSNADLHYTEQKLLARKYRTKDKAYWQAATIAPSALVIYLGVKGRLPQLSHHNLLFGKDWEQNFTDIFDTAASWPQNPSLYICKPGQTDPSVAPKGHENVFVLVPVATGLDYTPGQLDAYSEQIISLLGTRLEIPDLRQRIVYKQVRSVKDFSRQFNSYRGSALGLAHTLRQTAVFRPGNVNPKVKNLYYVGAGTNPGIGMPPALISAELMYKHLINDKSPGPLMPSQL